MSARPPVVPELFHEVLETFLAPLRDYLSDASVHRILVRGPEDIYIERGGRLVRTQARFGSAHELYVAVRTVAQLAGGTIGPESPILDARLPDGSHVSAVVPPAARHGASLVIRRAPRERLSLDQLTRLGALSSAARGFLDVALALRRNIIISGGIETGKTTFLQALMALVPEEERIVVLEEGAELELGQRHAVYLGTHAPDAAGQGGVYLRDLVRAALRQRPDRLLVGECRGAEAMELVLAMNAGYAGVLLTIGAVHAEDALVRLETLCQLGELRLPLGALRSQVAAAAHLVVHMARLPDGACRVAEIAECTGHDPTEGYQLATLFQLEPAGRDERTGQVLHTLEPTGALPSFFAELEAQGLELPAAMLKAGS